MGAVSQIGYIIVLADTAFEAAAMAAFMTTSPLNPTFDPYANDVFFLHGESLNP